MLIIVISVVQFLKNKLSCPSYHYLSLFLEFVILICVYGMRVCSWAWFAISIAEGVGMCCN